MVSVAAAASELTAALKTVDGLRVITDGTAPLDPPCALLGPPQLDWTTYGSGQPSEATFIVLIAVPADDRATERLWDFVVAVAATVEDQVIDAIVRQALPVSVAFGQSSDLPAYQLQVEMSL